MNKLNLESLEDRSLPAVTTITNVAGLLTINVNNLKNDVTVSDFGALIQVADNTNGKIWNYQSVKNVRFNGGSEDDRFTGNSPKVQYFLYGNNGNDYLKGNALADTIFGGNNDDNLVGFNGDDTIYGGFGDDTIVGGGGNDSMYGDAGNDYIVSIDNSYTTDKIFGGTGADVFWCDRSHIGWFSFKNDTISDFETVDIRYNIFKFTNSIDKSLDGDTGFEPYKNDYKSVYKEFVNKPLFSKSGPVFSDIIQGGIGDCWLMAGLSSMTRYSDGIKAIKNQIVDFGDGTFGIKLKDKFYRTSNKLPTLYDSYPYYAKLGNQGSMWVALYEKAFAMYRNDGYSYENLNGGFSNELWTTFDYKSNYMTETNPSNLNNASGIRSLLQSYSTGSVVINFYSLKNGNLPNNPIINISVNSGHAYAFLGFGTNSNTIILYNPWGIDGCAKNDGNSSDGIVTVTFDEMLAHNFSISYGRVNFIAK